MRFRLAAAEAEGVKRGKEKETFFRSHKQRRIKAPRNIQICNEWIASEIHSLYFKEI